MKKKYYPSFPLYPKDFLSSIDVQTMTVEEVGAYCLLMFNSWIQEDQCYLPDDEKTLKVLSKLDGKKWEKYSPKVLKKFKKKNKKIFNPRLVRELKNRQNYSKTQSEKGKKGGRPVKS